MVTPEDIRKKATLQYQQYLKYYYNSTPLEAFFPLIIRCDKKMDFSTYGEMERSIIQLQLHSDEKSSYGYSIVYEEKNTRLFGKQNVPTEIFFKSEKHFLKYIGKEKETVSFHAIMEMTLKEFPELKETMIKHHRQMTEHIDDWSSVMMVCRFFRQHPRPEKFVRELSIGVHTKFVETNRDILRPLLDVIVGEDDINIEATSFYGRFHLKEGDPMISFRILDKELSNRYLSGFSFSTVYVCEFARFTIPVRRIIIVENKRNLSQIIDLMPEMDSTLVIWGSGYMVSVLKYVEWLRGKEVFYWGDIDAQGYEILSSIRQYFPHINSIMMDNEALRMNPTQVKGTHSNVTKAMHLTKEEMKVYEYVKAETLRYEQEQLPQSYVMECLKKIICQP